MRGLLVIVITTSSPGLTGMVPSITSSSEPVGSTTVYSSGKFSNGNSKVPSGQI